MFKPILIVIGLSACSADTTTLAAADANPPLTATSPKQPSAALSQQRLESNITLTSNQASMYQDLSLQLLTVDDSRCPTGENCIWAGQMVVTVKVSNTLGQSEVVKLTHERQPTIVTVFAYQLALLDIQPHPKKGKDIPLSDQQVKLSVQKI